MAMEEKHLIIDRIIQNEWEMFITLNDGEDPLKKNRPSCRDFPEEFKLHRESKLTPWSHNSLSSYLNDLTQARDMKRNLMTYKYARMDNLIPCENKSPFIDSIATALVNWQKEFITKYPRIMSKGRALSGGKSGVDWPSFENYLRCELETYSERTLEYLAEDIRVLKKEGKSMSDEVYTHLIRKKGYDSIAQAERKDCNRP